LHIDRKIRELTNYSPSESFSSFATSHLRRRASGEAGKSGTTIMQRVTLVRYTAKPDRATENEALSKAVFVELKAAAPSNVGYALFRNGLEFVHLFVNLKDDDSSPVTELPSFKAYVKDIVERCEAPPASTRLTLQVLDSYGFPPSPEDARAPSATAA
jgi:hypothetical protein